MEPQPVTPLDLANHLFLPKRLPHREDDNLPEIEQELLAYLHRLSEPLLQRSNLPNAINTLINWKGVQGKTNSLDETFKNLKVKESACLYVRKQNCTIHFTKLDDDHMRVITFRASLPNGSVTETCGSLLATFPETLDVVPISPLLLSPCFSRQLENLTVNLCSIAMPVTKKADQEHPETRESSHPHMVSDFMVSMLCPVNPGKFGAPCDIEKIKFQKKLRDQVNWEDCLLPFRRSGLWTSAKVILRLCLQEEMGSKTEAYLMYKIILLEMLISAARDYSQMPGACWDINAQILTKLARRAKKLSEMENIKNAILNKLLEETLEHTWSTIEDIHGIVSGQWDTTAKQMQNSLQITKIDRSTHDWNQDCIHYMNDLTNYLQSERIPPAKSDVIDNLLMIDPVVQRDTVTLESLLQRNEKANEQNQDFHLNTRSVWIYQVEWFARHRMNSGHSCENIFKLLMNYVQCPGHHFSDPVYYSRFTVTALKFVAILDEIAVARHPLLKSYKTGIEPEIFHLLLIPEKCEMKLVEELQNYFQIRNGEAIYSQNWLASNKIGPEDFCVQYARENFNMKQLKENILNKMEVDIRRKMLEIQNAKTACDDLSRRIRPMTHRQTWSAFYEENRHDVLNCNLCSLQSQLEAKRVSVGRYQRPLPPTDYLRDAVVFELLIPEEIAALRDSVGILLEEILGHDESIYFPKIPTDNIHTNWMEFRELQSYDKTGSQDSCHLGSHVKDVLRSHYGGVRNPDVMQNSVDDFILENGLTCNYYRTTVLGSIPGGSPFTLKIAETQQKDADTYRSLQYALHQESPTENYAIARQNECHQNITLKEFKMFGSLRCAQHAQLRNLYAVLASKVLSLDKEPVSQVIMQTLWELGPGKRDIHVDFELKDSKPFALAFLEMLETSGEENATNWSNPMVFFSLSIATVRILEMSDSLDVKESASKILQMYRIHLEKWCTKLEELLVKSVDENDTKNLMGLLLKSAICTMFTFNVSSAEILPCIIKDPVDVTYLLKALSRLHHLVIRENILEKSPPSGFIQSLLRHARCTIPLNLQEYLHNKALPDSSFNVALHHFVCSNWNQAQNIDSSAIPTFTHSEYGCHVKKHAYQADYMIASNNRKRACVDILRGTFYVDGYPPSLLPENITMNPLYKTFFGTSQFPVQRTDQTFETTEKSKYRGQNFQFTEVDGRLIIRQLSPDNHGNWFELLPSELLKETRVNKEGNEVEVNKVPGDLIDTNNYTHWYDSKTKAVFFRRPSCSETEEIIEDDTDYLLVPSSQIPSKWHLRKYIGPDEVPTTHLISVNSPGFKRISKNLKKLERAHFIHVLMDKSSGEISANLWKHGLSFSLNLKDGLLYCDNYPGYYLPLTENRGQNIGTLIGLESGVILEKSTVAEPSGKKKIFVIQHGKVIIPEDDDDNKKKGEVKVKMMHQSVRVKIEGMRNPSYFVFEIDQILKRLRPGNNKSAWLYLAALHAATSSPFPDPFTQLTGTEMAMWILQSGFAWSCSPYDQECRETLNMISRISPKYEYYPKHLKVMETVKWPKGLSENFYAAYDGYAIIVHKLLEDSVLLSGLFPGKCGGGSPEVDLDLCHRSYYRNINIYNKAAHLSSEFVEDSNNMHVPFTGALTSWKPPKDEGDLVTLAEYRRQRVPSSSNLEIVASFIMTSIPLPQNTEDTLTEQFLPTWLERDLHENWLQLYSIALASSMNDDNNHKLTMILGAILYSCDEGTLQQILNLHTIAVSHSIHGVVFPPPPQSLTNIHYEPLNNEFVNSSITEILKRAADSPPSESSFTTYAKYKEALRQYQSNLNCQLDAAVAHLKRNHWPNHSIDRFALQSALAGHGLLNFTYEVLEIVNDQLRNWYNNRNLKLFIAEVDQKLAQVKFWTSSKMLRANRPMKWNLHFKTTPDTIDKWKENDMEDQGEPDAVAKQIFETGRLEYRMDVHFTLEQKRRTCAELAECFTEEFKRIVLGKCPIKIAFDKAGLHTRTVPVILLRDHFGKIRRLEDLREGSCYVGALAVVWAHLRRFNRLMMYDSDKKKYSVELDRELKTNPCEEWNPLENPEWLLLELELDITIRPIQVQVARRMMKMPKGRNGVMQLNMGEGKTSVIIPMIVATLSSSNTQQEILCRVTVLNSIYATNYNLLAVTIGGFLNKRLYSVPCSREVKIAKYLDEIQKVYLECVRLGGAVITLPEYRLSFRLQMYNNFLQENKEEVAVKIHDIETWLREHCRDLVDESDEIFSVKYQLIYTTGKQKNIDGGSMRWTVCQKLLEFLPQLAVQLFQKYGGKVVEFDPDKYQDAPHMFTPFRILGDECKREFYERIADGILNGQVNLVGMILKGEEREIVKQFLINEEISEEDHGRLDEIEGLSGEKKLAILLASGYLRRGILFAALRKRWRVEYGVKEHKSSSSKIKLMAVPFRAKDVAAERTEFGHPDMAIVLTQLSYYYSGLSDEQLMQCFHILETAITGPETVYKSWIKEVPEGDKTEDIKTYKGINLHDYEQKTKRLFPVLKWHKDVVNFWLENVAYPKECKQFQSKLVTNAWDLCYERNGHATTGFSGTNDTSLLLPAQITQQDLKVLKETNKNMEKTLLGEENQCRRYMKMGVTCEKLLGFMTKDGLRVLIDAGALMLEKGNEQIAQLWLDIDEKLQAVVYFNENGEMVTKVRRSQAENRKRSKRDRDQLLTLSQFKDRLEDCGIYLDDQHTRGTDIKLPTNFKACVTVGSGMRRDKLIQACMRMRKLGHGQSVHFYLSHEVRNKISLETKWKLGETTSVEDIINWTKLNSSQFEKDGLVYWATNARNYAKNLAADDMYAVSEKGKEDGKLVAERCEDPDAQELQKMYGTYYQQVPITAVVPLWFAGIGSNLSASGSGNLPRDTIEMLDSIGDAVQKMCEKHIPCKTFLHNMLEEEQEKELEPEVEVEEEKYRPPYEKPLKPKMHAHVKLCLRGILPICLMDGIAIARLSDLFRNTSIKAEIQGDAWGKNHFVTEDFINVIKTTNSRGDVDSFLRSIRFFVSFKNGASILILSLYEVDHLISDLRKEWCSPGTTLHMFSGRWMEGQSIFANDSSLQLPFRSEARSLNENVMAPLLIAAGNLYFSSPGEQKAFARFLGLRPRPWSKEEVEAFERKQVTNTGFVLSTCPEMRQGCDFQEDPTEMAMKICKMQNEVTRSTDHTINILESCAYLWSNEENNNIEVT